MHVTPQTAAELIALISEFRDRSKSRFVGQAYEAFGNADLVRLANDIGFLCRVAKLPKLIRIHAVTKKEFAFSILDIFLAPESKEKWPGIYTRFQCWPSPYYEVNESAWPAVEEKFRSAISAIQRLATVNRKPDNEQETFDFRKWYDDAQTLVLAIREAKNWRHRRHRTGNSISVTDEPTSEQIKQRFRDANARANAEVDAIFLDMELIDQMHYKLREGIESLWPLLEVGYFDLRDFETEGLPGGRCAWVAVDNLSAIVQRLGRIIAYARQIGRTMSLKELEEMTDREAWLGPTVDAIRARLALEKSWLLKNAQLSLVASGQQNERTPKKKIKTDTKRKPLQRKGELTDAQTKYAAAIEDWHGFVLESLSCTNCEAISYAELCTRSGVKSKASAKSFFDRWFSDGGNARYKTLCKNSSKTLAIAIAKLSHKGTSHLISLTENAISDSKAIDDEIDD